MIDEVFEFTQTKMIAHYCKVDLTEYIRSLCIGIYYNTIGWFIKNQEYFELWCIFIIILALFDLFSYHQAMKIEYERRFELQSAKIEKIEKMEKKWRKIEKSIEGDLDILFNIIEAIYNQHQNAASPK